MLWNKAWLDTRWRFLLALAVLLVFACGTVMSFPTVQRLAAAVEPATVTGDESLRQELQESLEASRTFRGYA
jgi:O-antigen ligase